MKTVNNVKIMKKIYPDTIVITKVGNFYYIYGKDCYIISYLFEYKIKDTEGVPSCGFPTSALDKVKGVLEKTRLNYIILNSSKELEEIEKNISFDTKTYNIIFEEAEKSVNKLLRIQKIYENMLAQIDSMEIEEKIEEIERILGKVEKQNF